MITPITATFPALNFPKEVDYPTQEDWAAFSAAAELNYGILSGAWSDKSEEFKEQTNNLALEIQEIGENAFNAISLNTIEDLATYNGTGLVMVKDINRGGIFVSKTAIEINPNTGSLYLANDGTVFAKSGGGFWVRHYSGAVNVKWFGAKGDWNGITGTDDTVAFSKALLIGGILEGDKNSTFLINTTTYLDCKATQIRDMNLKLVHGSVLFYAPTDKEHFIISNINIDGQRLGNGEEWVKFSEYDGRSSIKPTIGSLISVKPGFSLDGKVTVKDCTFKNIYANHVYKFAGTGHYHYYNLKFYNCANGTYYSYHNSDLSSTIADNIYCEDIGILPENFMYNNGATTVNVDFGDANMPMPQGSFCNIVSGGIYLASNVIVKNYGSCGITFDLNKLAMGENIYIHCDHPRAVSNNPSGAIWNEKCGSFKLNNFEIKIVNRGTEVGVSSALQIYSQNADMIISNGKIDTISSNILRPIRYSSEGGNTCVFDNLKVRDKKTSLQNGLFIAYSLSATIKDKITLNSIDIETYRIKIQPCENLIISNSKITATHTSIFDYDVTTVGITNVQENVFIDNTTVNINSFNIVVPSNLFTVSNSKFTGDINFTSSNKKIKIDNSFINGRGLFAGTSIPYVNLSNNTFVKRVALNNLSIFTVTGNTICIDDANFAVSIVGTPLAGTITGNNIIIKTGTASAGYVPTVANVIDANNNKVTATYDFS